MLTHFTAPDFAFWFCQIVLEAFIAWHAFRKGLLYLSGYAISRLTFDAITLAACRSEFAYQIVGWAAKPVEYFFLLILAFACIGEMLKESADTVKAIASVIGAVGIAVVALCYADWNYSQMLRIEAGVSIAVMLALIMGLLSQEFGFKIVHTAAPWSLIAWAVALLVGIDVSVDMVLYHHRAWWDVLARMRNLELVPLLLWAWAAKSYAGGEIRLSNGVKFEGVQKGAAE